MKQNHSYGLYITYLCVVAVLFITMFLFQEETLGEMFGYMYKYSIFPLFNLFQNMNNALSILDPNSIYNIYPDIMDDNIFFGCFGGFIFGIIIYVILPVMLNIFIIKRLIYYYKKYKNRNTTKTDANKPKYKTTAIVLLDSLFVVSIVIISFSASYYSKMVDKITSQFYFYIQPENYYVGIAANFSGYYSDYYVASLKNNEIRIIDNIKELDLYKSTKLWDQHFDLFPVETKDKDFHSKYNIWEPDVRLIPIGYDYIWSIKEKYPDAPRGKSTDLGEDYYKALHLYDKDMKKILTMQDDVSDLFGAGEDLVVYFKFSDDYAVVSLKQLIDSGGKVDKALKLPVPRHKIFSPPFAFEDKVFFDYDNMLHVHSKSSGGLIKSVDFKKSTDFFSYQAERFIC